MKLTIIALFFGAFVLATVFAGHHRGDCICTRDYTPVCGSNGRTYSNKCEFHCIKNELKGRAADDLKIVRSGECNGPQTLDFD